MSLILPTKIRIILIFTFLLIVFFIIFRDIFKIKNIKIENSETDKEIESFEVKNAKFIEIFSENKQEYKKNCLLLFNKIKNPDPKKIFKPPLKEPPAEMLKDFEMYDTPIKKFWYINEIYSDSDSNKKNEIKNLIQDSELEDFLKKIRNNEDFNAYHDFAMRDFFNDFSPVLKNRSLAVFGTQQIWIEAAAYNVGCREITTLEYTRKTYTEKQTILKWYHILDYFDKAIENKEIENFDHAASFSSFEHAGLGRYGDSLEPFGDYEAMQQVHCMLKPGGIFFVGLPISTDGTSYIDFNVHRFYGQKRLDLLFKGWRLLSKKKSRDHEVFALEKI